MNEFIYFLMALAVVVVPLYCAWLVLERLARRRGQGKTASRDRL